ncbi:MAG: hypothetical protein IIB56_10815 [Planctomycetes bacterium]|nr:hypothetical protein [Planctomycetota bacterium]
MNAIQKSHPGIVLRTVLVVFISPCLVMALEQRPSSSQDSSCKYFKIQVVDRQTGRGVPLVELRTTNNIRYFTDSNGIVAFYEPGLMDRDVFFFVESHGYEFPKDGFGFHGTRLRISRGASAVIKIDRLNVAERIYRITGQGIYRDSVLTGHPVPLQNPVLNGQVMGQDSVFTCIYHDRLFWMWGDTGRPSYPLGHFAMAGAVSNLPEQGGLDPAIGVDLKYYVAEDGFSRPLSALKEPGLVWLDGLLTVKDNEGRERMVAKFARLKNLGEVLERGLVVFSDATQSFEPLVRSGVEFLPFSNSGHAFSVNVEGRKYYYFATPFPLAVRMRVRAEWDDVIDANCYEVLTALKPKKSAGQLEPRLNPVKSNKPYRWIRFDELTGDDVSAKNSVIEALKKETKDVQLYDIETGKEISPHGGTVYFNAYRQRWISIFVQQFGESSFLGEVWYAEADTPVGPWAYARKIVTHNKYSFYNPKQHPYFDRDGGRVLFFEGTYTHTFSGSLENATPRYDYNQIMYRLNLDDNRLALRKESIGLPVAVYQIRDTQGGKSYLLRDGVEKAGKWDFVELILFYAIEPAKANDELVPVYAHKVSSNPQDTLRWNGRTLSLTIKRPNPFAKPLFYALPPNNQTNENSCVVSLYEYRRAGTGQRLYSTNPDVSGHSTGRLSAEKGWIRIENPLCRVWKTPPDTLLLDSKAKPIVRR